MAQRKILKSILLLVKKFDGLYRYMFRPKDYFGFLKTLICWLSRTIPVLNNFLCERLWDQSGDMLLHAVHVIFPFKAITALPLADLFQICVDFSRQSASNVCSRIFLQLKVPGGGQQKRNCWS